MGSTSEELSVFIRVQVAEFKKGVDQARGLWDKLNTDLTKGLTGSVAQMAAGVAGGLGLVEVIKRVAGIVADAVSALAQYERSLDSLGKKIQASGVSWADNGDAVKAYLAQIEEATRFSKEEAAAALDGLMLKTNNYSESLKLLELSMKYAVLANIPLEQASTTLGLAFEGNTRGVAQLARSLGIVGRDAKSAEFVLNALQDRVGNLAREENNMATSMDKLKHSSDDWAEALGSRLAPPIIWLAQFLVDVLNPSIMFIIGAFESVGAIMGFTALTIQNFLTLVANALQNWNTMLIQAFTKGPKEAFSNFLGSMKADLKTFSETQTQIDTETAAMSDEIWRKSETTKNKITADALAGRLKANTEMLREFGRSEAEYYDAAQKAQVTLVGVLMGSLSTVRAEYVQKVGESTEEFKRRMAEGEATAKEKAQGTLQAINAFAQGAASTISNVFAGFVKQSVEGTLTVGKAFKQLGEAIFKYLVKAIGQALVQEGAAYIAKGIASALGIITAPAAPGFFAAGASLMAAGGTIVGIADTMKFAEGGIVTEPTAGIFGEKGPEAVIPLDRAGGLLGGGIGDVTFGTLNMTFPNVRDSDDLRGPRFIETAQTALLEALIGAKNRLGSKSV